MAKTRLQHAMRSTAVGLMVNILMAVGKLIAGILGNSYALIADAIESFSDIGSTLIVWRGMVVAERPADADHPYGHGKAETLAAAMVALTLLAAAVVILVQSAKALFEPHGSPRAFTLLVLLGVVFIKEGLFRFVGQIGDKIESTAVQTDAWHHRSDAITSAAAALGISISLIGGPRCASADEWAAMFSSVLIAWNGWRFLRPAMRELMDAEPAGDLKYQARTIALTVTGVKGVEKCFARKMGYDFIVDMHVEVDGTMPVRHAHELAHQVKDAIRAELPRVREVTIHIEPFAVHP